MSKLNAEETEWLEVPHHDWPSPKFRAKKLKLLADAQIPQPVLEEMKANGVSIDALDVNARSLDDRGVLRLAQERRRVLLTLDADFWDDRRHPLQSVSSGIIYIAEPPSNADRVLEAFVFVYWCFAKHYPLDWWNHMKVRGRVRQFEVKMRTWEGKTARQKIALRHGRIVARELAGP